ncbi:protein YgfX [Stutzerimonas zhaodongensis]|uniref:protein YgfX n=1 Tax=Stutzerimonas TaxID=2901164 RepID=UPI003890D281
MSSPSNQSFDCGWGASRPLLVAYLAVMLLAISTLLILPVPFWLRMLGLVLCLLHACWSLPRHILLSSEAAWLGLRHDEHGWALWNRCAGWQPVQLLPDSIALPLMVIVRFKVPGDRFSRGVCVPRGVMSPEQHRRLRLRLKYSRRRWAAPG